MATNSDDRYRRWEMYRGGGEGSPDQKIEKKMERIVSPKGVEHANRESWIRDDNEPISIGKINSIGLFSLTKYR